MIDLVDSAQAAELADMPLATFRKYVTRGNVPEPAARFGQSPVWDRKTIIEWAATRPRKGQK